MCGGCGNRKVVDRDDLVVGMRNCGSKCSNRINVFGVLCLWRRKGKDKNEKKDTIVDDSRCKLKRKVYTRDKRKKKRKEDSSEEKSARDSLIGESTNSQIVCLTCLTVFVVS